jgi:transcriptional regulator with XRE-family HTH domain/quercetin dioxygenase-like cupin family protein
LARLQHKTNGSPIADASERAAQRLAERVARQRTRQGLRVSELARRIGVSPSLISQIERGQSRPSVSTLFALAEALHVPVDAFFRDEEEAPVESQPDEEPSGAAPGHPAGAAPPAVGPPPGTPRDRYVVRHQDRSAIDIDGGVRWERLTPTALGDVDFMELEYAPGAESNPTQYRHPGTEMILVLSGRLDITLGSERFELSPGDSMCFPSTTPHRYTNPTGEVARAVTVILPGDTAPDTSTSDRRP